MNTDASPPIIVPASWAALDLASLKGVLLVIGASDSGKSTFVAWLYRQLSQAGGAVALLDGDVGQSHAGLPTTLTLVWPPNQRTYWFIGDISPRGRMLPLVVGAGRLARRAREAGARTIIVDTTGLIAPWHGGANLKHALVDQLEPTVLFALRQGDELEPILAPLRHLPRPRLIELPVTDVVNRRDVATRQAHRARAFRRYFAAAGLLRLSLNQVGVFGGSALAPGRLLALQDEQGFALALGVIERHDPDRAELVVRTPLTDVRPVVSIRLGAIGVQLDTGRDFRPGR